MTFLGRSAEGPFYGASLPARERTARARIARGSAAGDGCSRAPCGVGGDGRGAGSGADGAAGAGAVGTLCRRGPHVLAGSRDGFRMGDAKLIDSMIVDGLWDVYNQYHMGTTAENVAKQYGISRSQQDEFAVASQNKAEAAQKAGKFTDEIVPVMIPQRKGDPVAFAADEFIKAGTTLESVSGLKPAFAKDGTVTAANASGINDGGAAVLVMSAAKAQQLGVKPMVRIKAFASSGVDPSIMGMGPVPASKRCLEKAGWKPADLDLMEINEAFAAQACAVNKEMGWDTSKINVNGGAIALGHPIGASGCRVLVTLLYEMARRDAKKGLASLCIGGGMGVAMAVER